MFLLINFIFLFDLVESFKMLCIKSTWHSFGFRNKILSKLVINFMSWSHTTSSVNLHHYLMFFFSFFSVFYNDLVILDFPWNISREKIFNSFILVSMIPQIHFLNDLSIYLSFKHCAKWIKLLFFLVTQMGMFNLYTSSNRLCYSPYNDTLSFAHWWKDCQNKISFMIRDESFFYCVHSSY